MITFFFSVLLAVPSRAAAPTAADAQVFLGKAEASLDELGRKTRHAAWLQQTDINYDSEWLAADADRVYAAEASKLAHEARAFDGLALPVDIKRKFLWLKLAVDSPAPPDLKEQKELSDAKIWLDSAYGKGKYCLAPDKCQTLNDLGGGYMNDFYAREFWRFVFVQERVGKLARTAIDYPPMQDPASFNLEAIKKQVEAAINRKRGD